MRLLDIIYACYDGFYGLFFSMVTLRGRPISSFGAGEGSVSGSGAELLDD